MWAGSLAGTKVQRILNGPGWWKRGKIGVRVTGDLSSIAKGISMICKKISGTWTCFVEKFRNKKPNSSNNEVNYLLYTLKHA